MIIRIPKSLKLVLFISIAVIIIIGVIAGLIIYLQPDSTRRGAVVTNGLPCSEIGMSILQKGGNAADAAIAALFCEGVAMPQSMGLGGGFLLTIYNKTTGEVWSLNARETAPANATEDMFAGDSSLSQRGILSIAVPGELVGYWSLYQKFGGQVAWKDLIQPTIDLCRNGLYITEYLARTHKGVKDILYKDEELRSVFIDPTTNSTYFEGQYVKRLKLAQTLEIIAEEGGYAINNGSLTESIANEIQEKNGIITADDLRNYKPVWRQPLSTTLLNNQTLYTSPLPGSGAVLTFILNMLSGFVDITKPESLETYQRIIESFKFGYGARSRLGDRDTDEMNERIANLTSKAYAEDIRRLISDTSTSQDPTYYGAEFAAMKDYGTAHISVLAPNGDAVAVTSTINQYFGSGIASTSTGIIFNDEMDDFSSPNVTNGFGLAPSPSNFIMPGKRPLSSMCPGIIVNSDGDVVLAIGAAGGSKITSAVASIIMKHLWFGSDIKSSIDDKRVHHQLYPMKITFETEFNTTEEGLKIIDGLQKIGHLYDIAGEGGFAAVTAVSNYTSSSKVATIEAAFDKRRSGSFAYV